MEHIQDLINFLLVIIPVGGALRIMYCLAASNANEDEAASYKIRVKHIVMFVVLAETISGLLKIVLSYFGR